VVVAAGVIWAGIEWGSILLVEGGGGGGERKASEDDSKVETSFQD
jgi:hypothetical protein